jgi:hypothetical protein
LSFSLTQAGDVAFSPIRGPRRRVFAYPRCATWRARQSLENFAAAPADGVSRSPADAELLVYKD